MTYEITRTARGRTVVLEAGPLPKMRARLRELRQSTARGVSGRTGNKYAVTYALRPEAKPPEPEPRITRGEEP